MSENPFACDPGLQCAGTIRRAAGADCRAGLGFSIPLKLLLPGCLGVGGGLVSAIFEQHD